MWRVFTKVAVARRSGHLEIVETPEWKQAKAELKRLNDELEKRIEKRTKELAETNEALKQLVALMPVAVYVCDTSGIIQRFNHRAVKLWGCEQKCGDPAQRYCGSLHLYSPDGKLVPHEKCKMAEVLTTGIQVRDLK